MIDRILCVAAGLAICVPHRADAQAVRTIYTIQNAILCGSPFSLKEAKTAAAAGDAKWLADLDCIQAPAGVPAIVIEASIPLGFFKVRVQNAQGEGVTAFGPLSDFTEPRELPAKQKAAPKAPAKAPAVPAPK
jgi:hypothetical protein